MTNQPSTERRLLSYKLAAAYLGISERAMKEIGGPGSSGKVKDRDKIQQVKIGHRVLFDRSDLDAYIERIKKAS